MFNKILIANRGEIAVRIIRACKEWGISTVAVHSDVDKDSMHVKLADESVCIGSHKPLNSYLNIPSILSAVELTNSDAVHPGYGFLSENFQFAKILEDNNLPVIEGSEGGISDLAKAKEICNKIGFPILIKAAGGGGGRGIKIVNSEEEFEKSFTAARLEAKKIFCK